MGKIYDALEKSQKVTSTAVSASKGSVVEFYEQSPKAPEILDLLEPLKLYDNVDKNLVTLLKPQSIESEMFKILRGNILFPQSGTPPKSIMITSSVPGEGKSFVSANLAVSIAQNINEHVLLMDCDIRQSGIHRILGLSDDVKGLSEYLRGEVDIQSIFRKTEMGKLSVMTGGRAPRNPAELLSSKKMSELLVEVKERYSDRYIIIDSPPPQLTAETSAIARQVDGVILVVKYGSTPKDMVADLVEIVGRDKILGCVLNWYDLKTSSYYGYGKYGKYSKYYHGR
ncbi:MAG: CpsD/CapB family tyrosine-protein kinase [Deltaproteobacteria bacterium]|nr:CpsD/CapB family tyrosine-protein kinase [Deltaproteobacteria bacterium]